MRSCCDVGSTASFTSQKENDHRACSSSPCFSVIIWTYMRYSAVWYHFHEIIVDMFGHDSWILKRESSARCVVPDLTRKHQTPDNSKNKRTLREVDADNRGDSGHEHGRLFFVLDTYTHFMSLSRPFRVWAWTSSVRCPIGGPMLCLDVNRLVHFSFDQTGISSSFVFLSSCPVLKKWDDDRDE